MTLSSNHIKEKTLFWMDNPPLDDDLESYGLIIATYGTGAFVRVPLSGMFINSLLHLPEDLREILLFARRNHCDFIYLDADEDTIQDLPSYDW
jgi:hypothetical protein